MMHLQNRWPSAGSFHFSDVPRSLVLSHLSVPHSFNGDQCPKLEACYSLCDASQSIDIWVVSTSWLLGTVTFGALLGKGVLWMTVKKGM